jgi:uncharacterized membrane protein HdeD (DUF308 family)
LFGAVAPGQHCLHASEVSPVFAEVVMIVLGLILLVIGFVAKVAILWTIGIVLVVIGAILLVLGLVGREVGGRKHWY